MKKLLLALALLASASVATAGRRNCNACPVQDCAPCVSKCSPDSEVIGRDSWIEYVECEIPRTVMDIGYKPVECSTVTTCTKNPCNKCYSQADFQATFGAKIKGPYKGN